MDWYWERDFEVFNVILAVNFFKNLPVELEEACFVDGATLEKSDIYLRTAGKTYRRNSCTVHHGYVLE